MVYISLIFMAFTVTLTYFVFKDYRSLVGITKKTEKMLQGGYIKISIKESSIFFELVRNINLLATRMENLESQKDSFISDVSHELKTPISTMKILSESIRYSSTEKIDTYKEFFSDINYELDRMDETITDLMDSVNLDPSNYTVNLKPIYLNYLCEIVIKRMNTIATSKEIQILFVEDADLQILIDFSKMERVLRNLIENSIKYSAKGSIIKLHLYKSGNFAYISVEDHGIGIPLSDLGRIFERFYRVDKDRSRTSGGTGLGLYITKNIIDMHEGEILVESTEKKGSKFTIKLPIR